MNHYEKSLNHFIELAQIEGFKSHVWKRAQELAKDPMWAGIDKELVKRIQELKHERNANT